MSGECFALRMISAFSFKHSFCAQIFFEKIMKLTNISVHFLRFILKLWFWYLIIIRATHLKLSAVYFYVRCRTRSR